MRRRTPRLIVFFDATSGTWAAYGRIMNLRAKIQVVICAELSKLDCGYEQIHVHLLSRLIDHLEQYFLHH